VVPHGEGEGSVEGGEMTVAGEAVYQYLLNAGIPMRVAVRIAKDTPDHESKEFPGLDPLLSKAKKQATKEVERLCDALEYEQMELMKRYHEIDDELTMLRAGKLSD
jgi:hypothetical protein